MDRHIGAQLYTLRDTCQDIKGFEETIKRVKQMGYTAVQISGEDAGVTAKEMRAVLDKYDMKVYCTHRSYEDFRDDMKGVIEYNKTLGSAIAGMGCVPRDAQYRTMDGFKVLVNDFNAFAKELAAEGLTFAVHNHAYEFTKLDGRTMMDILIEDCGDDVCFIFDTYWSAIGGIAPEKLIRRLGKRAIAIHFKDLKQNFSNKAMMAPILEGNLDWDEIIKACDEAGALYALIEHDECEDIEPFESLKISYNNLKSKGFC